MPHVNDFQLFRHHFSGTDPIVGAATGISELDKATGGLQRLTVVAGATQAGKTSLVAQMCLSALACDPSLVVVYYLLDNVSADDFFDLLICNVAKVAHQKFESKSLSREENERVVKAMTWLQTNIRPRMVTVKDPPIDKDGFAETWVRMFIYCDNFRQQVGAERVMVVLDMFDDLPLPANDDVYAEQDHKIEADPNRWRLEQVRQFGEQSERCFGDWWPIVILAKLRKSLQRGEPSIEDLLGSVQLGYKADRIIFLVPDHDASVAGSPVVPVTLTVKKGRRGTLARIPLLFHHAEFRFEEARGRNPATTKKSGASSTIKGRAKKGSGEQAKINPLAGMDP